MRLFVNYTLVGVTQGLVYAAVALALVLAWRSTRILNFAQGAMAMITTYIAATLLEHSVGYWEAFIAAIAAGLVIGAVTERLVIRPVEARNPLNAVIVAIGVLIFLEALAAAIWGSVERGFPAPFSLVGYRVGGHGIELAPFDVFVIVAVLVMMALLLALFRFTALGLRMRASAFSPEVAGMLGVRVKRLLTLGWALAAAAGALAGLFVAPSVFLYPQNMDSVLIFGFTAAIIGGLESPLGALAGGLVSGLAWSYVGGYIGPSFQASGAVALLVVVLMVRPSGLFSSPQARRV
ncbi:MAG: branched-chain amino acid ABC transporter permease [Acidimicrobiales bacterium]|jgi:branched-chain amino acid transport system permease protein